MKTKRLMLMSCFAAAALITSPAFGEMHKKSMATSASKAQRMAPRMVAQVQRRLGELDYYHGLVAGIMGPQTRAAVAAYEGTHNLVVDGTISQWLLARMGLA